MCPLCRPESRCILGSMSELLTHIVPTHAAGKWNVLPSYHVGSGVPRGGGGKGVHALGAILGGAEMYLIEKILDQQFDTYLSEIIEKLKIVHDV